MTEIFDSVANISLKNDATTLLIYHNATDYLNSNTPDIIGRF